MLQEIYRVTCCLWIFPEMLSKRHAPAASSPLCPAHVTRQPPRTLLRTHAARVVLVPPVSATATMRARRMYPSRATLVPVAPDRQKPAHVRMPLERLATCQRDRLHHEEIKSTCTRLGRRVLARTLKGMDSVEEFKLGLSKTGKTGKQASRQADRTDTCGTRFIIKLVISDSMNYLYFIYIYGSIPMSLQ
ncbi:uncharacterized protein BCR38DRAFT_496937 [Pseudomassariella vexata]|uniref:Uncharacterized protein n=1 Tax=Pseudomassariella vexata TaxID=1141098 RepID=A0A1Y2DP38_9PEZI|nr:uncharacterized protein BCR38DRAFT_496937 [Pseudomassariella vexata]ORY60939.1 hypothetical protein BCR38DRAFT_496937 [Pseudomassariella vexata]